VEQYLHSGELTKGQQEIERALAAATNDDQLRFGLGVLRFVRAVERLGQSFYEHGLKSEHQDAPFLRLPVPANPDPATIRYADFRRLLDEFRRDLMDAEAVLAGVADDQVALPLRLAEIHLDLDGDGSPSDRFVDVLRAIMRRDADFLRDNPAFLVRFDRGDVAWLRAYCHLLASMVDIYLAFDTQTYFDLWSHEAFARPQTAFAGTTEERWEKMREAGRVTRIVEPARLDRFRRHVIQVAELNRETWKHIRAETDDDNEWLPNAKQQGVLRLPVRDTMIDAWLRGVTEIESLMNGKTLLPIFWRDADGKGINLKTLLEAPPVEFRWEELAKDGLPEKYLEHGPPVDFRVFFLVFQVFENTTAVGYMVWFN
ncbi:MAG: hypothetical protein MUF25_28940, partial [Pirellulaceae bacterium]|nr:hypothetical protein [Pirellulaceae bacterium]